MKIACESCASRYSIADDKVRGKSFRIRCKRCGEAILVHGPSEPHTALPVILVSSATSRAIEADASGGMTGARQESSVLFSLGTLQQLSKKGPATPSARRPAVASASSGLLDLRALVAAAPSPAAAVVAPAIDELLTIGGPGAFAPSPHAPVLVPAPFRSSRLLHSLVAVAATLLVGIIALLALALAPRASATTTQIAPPVVTAPTSRPAAPIASPTAASAPAAPVAPPRIETPADQTATRAGTARETTRRPPRETPVPEREMPAPVRETPAPVRVTTGHETIEELVRRAAGPEGAEEPPREPTPDPVPATPAQPARADVHAALRTVQEAVRACAAGQSGTATVRFVFAPSGLVTTTSVTAPPFAGTPAGSCMARAARAARVPPFSGRSLVVSYPFVVR